VPLLAGLDTSVVAEDADLWAAQRAGQRAADGVVLRVSGRPTDLPAVLAAARSAGAGVVSRAALGVSWLTLPPGDGVASRVGAVRDALAPRACTVLDGAHLVADPWPRPDPGVVALMERVKARFDPPRVFRPGTFVGGI
jgi:glycolate oxidase FAD binding subunit